MTTFEEVQAREGRLAELRRRGAERVNERFQSGGSIGLLVTPRGYRPRHA